MENVKQCPNWRCADKTHSEAHAVVWRCDDCRAVGAIHWAHPDECGGMKQVASDHFVDANKMVPNSPLELKGQRMGIDTEIYIKTKTGKEPELENNLPDGFEIGPTEEWGPEGATHEVRTGVRYYGKGYERGPWPYIAATLMLLLASEDIETVWYGGDCHDSPEVCTPETVAELNLHFMTHGNRPYRRP